MSLLAVPFDWRANPSANTAILDAFCQHPGWFSAPLKPEEVRVAAAALVTHPDHLVWGVWNGGSLVGGLLFTEHVPQVSARLHFVFLDNNLVGRRKFLWQFIGRAFRDLQLQRIGYECPEGVPLIKFARSVLHFKYEGEGRVVNHPAINQSIKHRKLEKPDVWVARQGSRRQASHWHAGEWKDVMLLRLLRTEYEALESPEVPCPQPPSSPLEPPLVQVS